MRREEETFATSQLPERLRRRLRAYRKYIPSNPQSAAIDDTAILRIQQTAEELTNENATLRDTVLRQKAEFDNFRRRTLKEKNQAREQAIEDMLAELLPVLDNFERALESVNQSADAESIREGIRMVRDQMARILSGKGLERIQAQDADFNPEEHDAVAVEERSDVPENRVVQEMLPGYRYNERVIRPAMVKVARAPSAQQPHG